MGAHSIPGNLFKTVLLIVSMNDILLESNQVNSPGLSFLPFKQSPYSQFSARNPGFLNNGLN